MRRIVYYHPKRKKRIKKKLKQGPFNLIQYHQFPFLYDENEEEDMMDLDEESSYFASKGPRQNRTQNCLVQLAGSGSIVGKKRNLSKALFL